MWVGEWEDEEEEEEEVLVFCFASGEIFFREKNGEKVAVAQILRAVS